MHKLFTLVNRIRLELYEQPSLTMPNSYVICSRVSPMTHDVSTSGPRGLEVLETKNTGKITTVILPVYIFSVFNLLLSQNNRHFMYTNSDYLNSSSKILICLAANDSLLNTSIIFIGFSIILWISFPSTIIIHKLVCFII